ncbi:Metallo-dependent phosphatase [Hypoxylon rubiginosum]|uniref:Metallo-dependent phosphatase n=1 Tax=Hypoxylon rubiginosum TaxID=110542 RepID=A0ACB9YK70_9PEZI|nr:Metallo-dependent phosphatase [Hypoxylon rubiginosum]
MDATSVTTKFLVISDTHGADIPHAARHLPVDVAIHCGDLTEESKIDELRIALKQLQEIEAPLKLVIPGNHDFTMDVPTFKNNIANAPEPLDPALVRTEYGDYGEAKQMFEDMKAQGIHVLEEGTHQFELSNGALLSVYASPFTPSLHDSWGFHYPPEQHNFDIPKGVDVVITHGPPHGVMDFTASGRGAGCPNLFRAVAHAQPKLHCFGHIHEGWGAKLATWREHVGEAPANHFADIDHDESVVVEKLSGLTTTRFDTVASARAKRDRRAALEARGYAAARHGADDERPLRPGQTLFVNAAVEGSTVEFPAHMPWVVDIDLPHQ